MIKSKYLRIQGRELSHQTGKPVGIFSLCWRSIRNNIFSTKDADQFINIDIWFKEHLPEPPFYKDHNPDNAITFFKVDTSLEFLEKMTPVFVLLQKYNIAYDLVYTDSIGKILYEDEYQVAVVDES